MDLRSNLPQRFLGPSDLEENYKLHTTSKCNILSLGLQTKQCKSECALQDYDREQ